MATSELSSSVTAAASELLVLYHPAAGGGTTLPRLQRLFAGAPRPFPRVRLTPVRSVAEACAAIEAAPEALPVAAGGDGTANLVACARLAQADDRSVADPPALGILPVGTGNALAAAFGLDRISAALGALAAETFTLLDVMRTTHPSAPVALVSISTGFESSFVERYSQRRSKWTRLGAGIDAVLGAHTRRWRAQLVADGRVLADGSDPIYNAGLYNTRCYAFGVTPWPDADHDDGLAEAIVVRGAARYWRCLARGLRTAIPYSGGDPSWARCRVASFTSESPFQVDGEFVAAGAFDVRIQPAALRLLVPAPLHARRSSS